MNEEHAQGGTERKALSRYRVWIASCGHGRPQDGRDLPAEMVALRPAELGTMTRLQAARYVEAFNRAVLDADGDVWAVAVPVAICYEGDPRPGQTLTIGAGREKGTGPICRDGP